MKQAAVSMLPVIIEWMLYCAHLVFGVLHILTTPK
jgi:hypothetical protein